jgi:PAS domain S-box-containing protein
VIPAIGTFWISVLLSAALTALFAAIYWVWRVRERKTVPDPWKKIGLPTCAVERIDGVFRGIAENSPQGLIVIQDFRVIFANSAFARICGFSVEELLAFPREKVRGLIHPDDAEYIWKRYSDRLRGKPPAPRTECRGVRKDGSVIWIEVSSTIVEFDGKSAIQATVSDITERKHAEQALRESESRNRAVLNAVPDLMFQFHRDGTFFDYHAPAKDLYLPPEDFMGKKASEVLPPDLAALTMQHLELAITTGKTQEYEYELAVDNELGTYEARMVPCDNGDVLVIVRNITSHKKAQKALRETELQLRSAIESLPFDLFALDSDGRYVLQNSVCRQHWGDLIGKRPDDCDVSDEVLSIWLDNNKQAFAGQTVKGEVEFEVPGHGKKDLFNIIGPIRDCGKIKGILGVNIDITELKRAERALGQSERLYHQLVNNAPVGIVSVDIDGNVVDANPASLRLFSCPTLEEARRVNVLHSENVVKSGIADDFKTCLSTGQEVTAERPIVTRWGTSLFLRYHLAALYNADGQITGAQVVVENVAAQRRLEEELANAEKLESIGVLAGGIAHDFNNILTAALGNVSLAKLALSSADDTYDSLSDAEKAIERAQDLTQQLLTFSKGGDPVREAASLPDLIRECAGFALRGSNVKCHFEIDEDLRTVEIDRGQISQVMNNLIINADQAMPNGGKLWISAHNVTQVETGAPVLLPAEYVEVCFKDQGVGIDKETLPRIFDPYFTTKEHGSGLGLATVYSIVKKHNGFLNVESKPGEGTTFHVYLPASERAPEPIPSSQSAIDRGEGKLLLMDDEESIRVVAGRMLTGLGYSVDLVAEGASAVAMFQAALSSGNPYDLVILDLTIPGGMGGLETLSRLKRISPDVRAIVSTGYSNDPVIANYRESGFLGYVGKPYRTEQLAQVVHQVLTPALSLR